MKRTFAMLCVAAILLLTGCTDAPQQPDQSQPPSSEQPSSVWIASEDGVLSLRLGSPDTTVRFEYRIVVRSDLDGIIPQPQDTGNAGGPGPSGLYPFEEILGEGQSYSLRDVGLGFPRFDVIHVEKGTDVLSFEWDGKNWGGPSDTDAPKGPPFPPGVYNLKLSLKGYERTPDGDEPYEISRSATVRLVP